MAGAGGDLTTTVATALTRITLVATICIIIATTVTTINDDNGSGAYELRYPLTDKCSHRRHSRDRESMRLLDYVSNFFLWTYKYDLIFSDEEFVRFYFRHFLHHQWRKVVQSNIGRYFVPDPHLLATVV